MNNKHVKTTIKEESKEGSQELQYLGTIIKEFLQSDNALAVEMRRIIYDMDKSEPTFLANWLDNQDVMELLHISSRTLQNYRSTKILPYSIIGGRCVYKRSDVEWLLEKSAPT